MTFKEIQELIKLVGKSNLTEVKLKKKDFEISIRTKKYRRNMQQVMSAPAPIVSMAPTPQVASPAPAPPPAATKPAPSAQVESNGDDTANLLEVKSPIVGTFYRSSSPDKPAFVKVGDSIATGDVVCIVEAMKLFNEIESEISGKIVKVMCEDASPVEYDQVLFLVDPNG